MKKTVIIATLAASLCGCVSTDQLVDSSTSPSVTNGYIGGAFAGPGVPMAKGAYYAFVFTETQTGKAYTLPFFPADESGYHADKLSLIEAPPGHYRFSHWVSYRAAFGEVLAKSEQAPGKLNEFDVSSSRVTFIGKYKASDEYASINETKYKITPVAAGASEIAQRLAAQYPGYRLRDN